MNEEISKNEIIVGLIAFAFVVFGCFMITGGILQGMEQEHLLFQQALKTTDQEQFRYAMDTQVGNVLSAGDIGAINPVGLDDIDGEYFAIKKVKEEYRMHTRVVTYSCGESICTRTEMYYTWDWAGEDKKQTRQFSFMGMEFNNICDGDWKDISLKEKYKGDKKICGGYVKGSCWDNTRWSYKGIPKNLNATIFIRSNKDKFTNPLNEKSCIPLWENKQIEQVVDSSEPNYRLVLVGSVLIVAILGIGYIYISYKHTDY